MAGRLEGKVVIVTGAGSIGEGWGNGKAAAVLFAREGARIFAVDIDDAANCLAVFKSNIRLGWIVFAGLIAGQWL